MLLTPAEALCLVVLVLAGTFAGYLLGVWTFTRASGTKMVIWPGVQDPSTAYSPTAIQRSERDEALEERMKWGDSPSLGRVFDSVDGLGK